MRAISCGWAGCDVPFSCKVLEVQSNPEATPEGCPTIKVVEDRAEQLLDMLKHILKANRLGPRIAGNVWGRLQLALRRHTAESDVPCFEHSAADSMKQGATT